MAFRNIFIAVLLAGALIVGALILNSRRPEQEVRQPSPEFVRATGKCAQCHREETAAIVVEFEQSAHAAAAVTCLDCHAPRQGQVEVDHRGFVISSAVTALNCSQCHATEYRQFLRSRHAAPAYAAVEGSEPFTEEQIEFAEQYHPEAVRRPPNALARLEGESAIAAGCVGCHSVGRPNPDGSIGTCSQCHARHIASVYLARTPETCGQCHMGPDHAQIEIYNESKHGALFNAQKQLMNLAAAPDKLTVEDMPIPTCATCHMSGLEGLNVTHDVTERLSYWLFAPVSERRPTYQQGQDNMQEVCLKCHTTGHVDRFYELAEAVVESTNEKVLQGTELYTSLQQEGLLKPGPFDDPIDFVYFDFWHYYGRSAKHGAFMGGADFVQWHGNYELLAKLVEMQALAEELRAAHGPSDQ